MGMGACYMRISNDLLESLKKNPDDIEEMVFENEELEEQEFDIDKAWHGIYFLLTGVADLEEPVDSLLGAAVLGGTEIGEEAGYESFRYLEVEEVKEVTAVLKEISVQEFASRYNVEEMNKHDIYPMGGDWMEDDKEYLVENFIDLVEFFKLTAEQGEAMLLFMF